MTMMDSAMPHRPNLGLIALDGEFPLKLLAIR
jgi:hypothetical protein